VALLAAYVSIRQHTSAYVSARSANQLPWPWHAGPQVSVFVLLY
jgi:hypothetical protein